MHLPIRWPKQAGLRCSSVSYFQILDRVAPLTRLFWLPNTDKAIFNHGLVGPARRAHRDPNESRKQNCDPPRV